MGDPLEPRRRQQDALRQRAQEYLARLSTRISVTAAALVGSAARGDFNVWSDIDVVVVTDDLPAGLLERSLLLTEDAPPGVQAVGFTSDEFARAYQRHNPLALEAARGGAVLRGRAYFARLYQRTGRAGGA